LLPVLLLPWAVLTAVVFLLDFDTVSITSNGCEVMSFLIDCASINNYNIASDGKVFTESVSLPRETCAYALLQLPPMVHVAKLARVFCACGSQCSNNLKKQTCIAKKKILMLPVTICAYRMVDATG
jgi:hypothetical protein